MKGISKFIDEIHKTDIGKFTLIVTNDPHADYVYLQLRDSENEVQGRITDATLFSSWLADAKEILKINSTNVEPLARVSLPPLGKSLLSDI